MWCGDASELTELDDAWENGLQLVEGARQLAQRRVNAVDADFVKCHDVVGHRCPVDIARACGPHFKCAANADGLHVSYGLRARS